MPQESNVAGLVVHAGVFCEVVNIRALLQRGQISLHDILAIQNDLHL